MDDVEPLSFPDHELNRSSSPQRKPSSLPGETAGLPSVTMGVPFEALLPYAIMTTMFAVTGGGLATLRYIQNGGKRQRRALDTWDRQMMDRDRRLTGIFRGQTDNAVAPAGFELNNPWKTENRIH